MHWIVQGMEMVSIADIALGAKLAASGVAKLLAWGYRRMWSRLLVVGLFSLPTLLPLILFKQYVDRSSEFIQHKRSGMVSASSAAARNGYLLDLLEECLKPRDVHLADHSCDEALDVYAEVRIGPAVGHREEVVARRDFPRMRIDARAAQRLRELDAGIALRPSWQEEWARALRITWVHSALAGGVVVLLLVLWGMMLAWTDEGRAMLRRLQAPTTEDEDDSPFGDVPNLPHERIHHPDRR